MKLTGITIIDLTRLLPGPFATQQLVEMGAEVVKIEPPDNGDYAREYTKGWQSKIFESVNNGKKSVILDLQSNMGRDAFYELVKSADVVFEQFRPGVVERLGIDYDTLTEYNPELVYCSLSGYGQEGPYAERVGHDLNYAGFAGLLDMTRQSEDEAPRIPGYQIGDMSGALVAVSSILSALLARELGTGSGNYIDLAMADTVLSIGLVDIAMAADGIETRPGETTPTGKNAYYNVYETKDERYVTLAASEPKFWRSFCKAVDRPDLIDSHTGLDEESDGSLEQEIQDVFGSRTWAEWEEKLGDAKNVPFGLVKSPTEALEDSQFQERGIVQTTADGRIRLTYPANVADGLEMENENLPDLGEHTESVLFDTGLSQDDIEHLREQDAI